MAVGKKVYFLSVGFSSGGGAPFPASILADRSKKRNRCECAEAVGRTAGAGVAVFGVGSATRIYVATGATDMRKRLAELTPTAWAANHL